VKELSSSEYSREALQRMVRSVTFFKDIVKLDESQFELILSVCGFFQASADEIVLRKGDKAHTLYFLLKGQMAVISGDDQNLNIINPGEVFGTLSMVTGRARTATVRAESNVILLGVDFKFFQEITDASMFSIETKLVAYRMVVHNIRWTLEMNKMQYPNHELVPRILKLPIYTGERGCKAELEALYAHSRILAELLCEWNDSLEIKE
jgi:CRP-like cAMP-binding protein